MDPIEQLVSNNIELDDKSSTEFLNCTAILARCGIDKPNRGELNRVAVFLRKQGFETNWDKKFPVIFKSKEGDMPTRVDFKMRKLAVLSPEKD